MAIPSTPEAPRASFDAVTPAQWSALAARRVYFVHQSVGANIMAGAAEVLAQHPDLRLRIVESPTLDPKAPPGIYHARLGHNGDPASKTAALETIVNGGTPDVAILKYCYEDVRPGSDPDALFAAYRAAVAALRARHPGLVIVHATMPLTTIDGWKWSLLEHLRGHTTRRDLDVIRNRYNALLRQAYVGREPVFDIARIESTRPDGSRAFFTSGRDTAYVLAAENTDDGGHLNAPTRVVAAREFLAVLAAAAGHDSTTRSP